MREIVIATSNQGKVNEIKKILEEYELISLKEIKCEVEIIEDGETFEKNAKKKAREVFEITNMPCIADDSGLCIDILDGWPGVYSARFLGENKTDFQRNKYIIEKMRKYEGKERIAKNICVVVYYNNGEYLVARGEVKGNISKEERGENGFGFDPIFEISDGKTLAELTIEEKNKNSARKKALENLKKQLTTI